MKISAKLTLKRAKGIKSNSVYNIYTFVKVYFVLFASVPAITKVSQCKGEEDVKVEVENDEEEKKIKNENPKSPVEEKVLIVDFNVSLNGRMIHGILFHSFLFSFFFFLRTAKLKSATCIH